MTELRPMKLYFDGNRMVELEDDVLNVVRDVREIDPRIHIFYNEQTDGYDLVEDCLDGVQRLVFSVEELDARVPLRLRMADQWRGRADPEHVLPPGEDFLDDMDRYNEALKREQDEQNRDKIRDAGERLAWALQEDRRGVQASILVPKDLNGRPDAGRLSE
jgi:hypothetical protein